MNKVVVAGDTDYKITGLNGELAMVGVPTNHQFR
jgi:hypothetical protein